MATSIKAVNKYNKKTYENITLRVKKGEKAVIQARADELGKSLNGYISDLIFNDISQK